MRSETAIGTVGRIAIGDGHGILMVKLPRPKFSRLINLNLKFQTDDLWNNPKSFRLGSQRSGRHSSAPPAWNRSKMTEQLLKFISKAVRSFGCI